jgi:hypothetical protein
MDSEIKKLIIISFGIFALNAILIVYAFNINKNNMKICPICGSSYKGNGSNVYERLTPDAMGRQACKKKSCIVEMKRINLSRHAEWFPDE